MQKKNILIAGAGSLGTYLGIKLSQFGHHLTIYGRHKLGETSESIFLNNELVSLPPKIDTLPREKKYDVIFITSKLYDVEKIVIDLEEHDIQSRYRVSIQNGMFDKKRFPQLGAKSPVIITSYGAFSLYEKELSVSLHPSGFPVDNSEKGRWIAKLLQESGVDAHTDKTEKLRLVKMLYNCVVNGLGSLHAKTLKELFSEEEFQSTINHLFDECYAILNAEYNDILDDKVHLKEALVQGGKKMNHYVSTYRDVIAGKQNEIEYLNGYIVDLGKKHGLPYTHHEKIINDLEPVIAMYKKVREKGKNSKIKST